VLDKDKEIICSVSIIIVAFNNKDLLAETLHSLSNQTYRDFEIIVVDNNSPDGTSDLMKTVFQEISYMRSDVNLGFSGGNNLGLKHARGEYVALLNNDAVAQPSWLGTLVKAMNEAPDVGICASKMLVFGTELIDSAGDGFSSSLKGFKRGEGLPSSSYDECEYVFGACAGAALHRRTMLNEIGFLDNDFFLIHEDADLNFRAQLAGWKVLYVPTAVVYHKVRSTIGHMSDTAVYYTLRNSEFVRIKNVPFQLFLRTLPAFILGMIFEFIYFVIRHKKFKLYAKAKLDVLKKLGIMLDKRKEIMSMKKVNGGYLRSIMTPVWEREFFLQKLKKFFSE